MLTRALLALATIGTLSACSAGGPVVASTTSAPSTVDIVRVPGDLDQPFRFSPATLTVTMGSVVRFVDHEDVFHTVTFLDRTFSETVDRSGTSVDYRATTVGRYIFVCDVHAGMEGTLTIVAFVGGGGIR